MSVDIKQLVIKSTIANGADGEEPDCGDKLAELKEEIMNECRRLLVSLLQENER